MFNYISGEEIAKLERIKSNCFQWCMKAAAFYLYNGTVRRISKEIQSWGNAFELRQMQRLNEAPKRKNT